MRILREGNGELVIRSRKFECDNCGCVFVANKNEYRYIGNQREGDAWRCNCPYCGEVAITSEVPLICDLEIVKIPMRK